VLLSDALVLPASRMPARSSHLIRSVSIVNNLAYFSNQRGRPIGKKPSADLVWAKQEALEGETNREKTREVPTLYGRNKRH
jgi:hypothetical protein